MNDYESYYLRANPFPATPVLDPISDDIRINGTIYNPDIMAAELKSFRSKLRQRPPLIYIENSDFVRGVGKSALMVQQWRHLQQQPGVTSIYIRSGQKHKPVDFAAGIIGRWHQGGYLWPTIRQVLAGYVRENPRGEITPTGAQVFAETFPDLPTRPISLLNFNVFNPSQLVQDLASWASRQVGEALPADLAAAFFQSYLSDPSGFPQSYSGIVRKQKGDDITMLKVVYRLLKLGGHDFHYLFFDQFEDVVHGLSGKALIAFNTEMRRLIEASIDHATLIVTLHPGATATLSSNEGADITSIAPLDQRHVVDVRRLPKEAVGQLAKTYLDHFRLADSPPPDALYPFTMAAVEDIYESAKGNIRACLQSFSYALEKGVDEDCPVIDAQFLARHHSEITGRVHTDDINL